MIINDLLKSFDIFDKNIGNNNELIIQYNLQKELYTELKKTLTESHENVALIKKLKDVITLNEKIIRNNFPNVVILYDENLNNEELFKNINLLRLKNRKYNFYAINSHDTRLNKTYNLTEGKVNVIIVNNDIVRHINDVNANYGDISACL